MRVEKIYFWVYKSGELTVLDFIDQFNWQGNNFFCSTMELGTDPRKAVWSSTNIQKR